MLPVQVLKLDMACKIHRLDPSSKSITSGRKLICFFYGNKSFVIPLRILLFIAVVFSVLTRQPLPPIKPPTWQRKHALNDNLKNAQEGR